MVLVQLIPLFSKGLSVMWEVRHIQQAFCESLSPHWLKWERLRVNASMFGDRVIGRRSLTRLLWEALAILCCTGAGFQQEEVTQCQR